RRPPPFGRGIGGDSLDGLKRKYGCDVYDLSPTLAFDHVFPCKLGQAKDTREINFDNCSPIFFTVINGRSATNRPCVVDENIESAEVTDRFSNQDSCSFT